LRRRYGGPEKIPSRIEAPAFVLSVFEQQSSRQHALMQRFATVHVCGYMIDFVRSELIMASPCVHVICCPTDCEHSWHTPC